MSQSDDVDLSQLVEILSITVDRSRLAWRGVDGVGRLSFTQFSRVQDYNVVPILSKRYLRGRESGSTLSVYEYVRELLRTTSNAKHQQIDGPARHGTRHA